ncbi:hypothetical protein RND71_038492 [Anisodus tanguticus]|uniref:Uncharacterized protein n=1 Tax=Anisodus tanguticus TaxID=243964 RepID=A0AAE1R0H0_9SOLA|nr:hypothetical protein RND71_038492 [Anisodus tanguticus]
MLCQPTRLWEILASKAWNSRTYLPRFALVAAELNGALYAVGGYDGSNYLEYALGGYDGSTMVPRIEIYDPRLGTWMIGEPMNHSRGYSVVAVLKKSNYVIGEVLKLFFCIVHKVNIYTWKPEGTFSELLDVVDWSFKLKLIVL